MSTWADNLKSHAIWQTLDTLGPLLDEVLERQGNTPADVENLARLKAVLALAGKRVAGLDAQLISFPILGAVANNLNEVAGQVRLFAANGNPGHLSNANGQADSAIQNLAVTTAISTDSMVWSKEAAEAYQRGLSAMLIEARASVAQSSEELGALRTRVSELSTEIASEKQRLTLLTSEHQSQFSAAQEGRRQESGTLHKQHDEVLTALGRDYAQKLEAESKEFAGVIERAEKAQETALASLRAEFVAAAAAMTDEMNKHRSDVEKLVGVIGELGVTSGYKTTADQAAQSAAAWQKGTVGSLAVFALVAAVTLFQIVQGEFSWMGLAGRVFISVAFGVLAGYCGAQAEKYQRVEVRNRKLALELAALGPFLAPLPKEKQDDFRLTMGARTFGREETAQASVGKGPTSAIEILNSKEVGDLVIDALKKALK